MIHVISLILWYYTISCNIKKQVKNRVHNRVHAKFTYYCVITKSCTHKITGR